MTITTETSRYLTKELRGLADKEGLEGPNIMKRVVQLRKQGYIVVTNKSTTRGWVWRVYETEA
jgi:hypothetical protein